MTDGERFLVMGHVVGAYATRGWIRIQPFTEEVDGLLQYRTWWIGREGDWREVTVEDGAAHGQSLVAKLAGVDTREQAAGLRGLEVGVPRSQLPANDEGEYYWADLQDMAVRNVEGQSLGVVEGVLETGGSPVLVVKGDRERLIPFVDPVVRAVDAAQGLIVVDWGADY